MKERRVTEARIIDIIENAVSVFWQDENRVAVRDLPRNRRIEVISVEVEREGVIGVRIITVIRRAGMA